LRGDDGRRNPRSRDIPFLVFVAAVVGLLVVLSLRGKERFIGRTPAHLGVAGIADDGQADAVCLSCHGGDPAGSAASGAAPGMSPDHPSRKKNCRQCHRLERRKP